MRNELRQGDHRQGQSVQSGKPVKEKERRENSPETQPILQVCFSTGRMWAAQVAQEVLGIHGDLGGP